MIEVRPVALFYAGANGAGKSTLRRLDRVHGIEPALMVIDPDIIARTMDPVSPRSVDLAAGKEAIRRVHAAIEQRLSFTMETTLTGHGALRRIAQAKAAGFEVRLVFVGLDSPEHHIARIAGRVLRGGHFIDDNVVRRRYVESLLNMPRALTLVDEARLLDNTFSYTEFFRKKAGVLERIPNTRPLPEWLRNVG